MPWKKGQSGNPAGRKPRGRTLTDILEKAGSKTIFVGGKRISGKRLLARVLWDIALTGKATFPDGTELIVSPADYLQVIKFIYQHIDGPPKAEMDITSGGESLSSIIEVKGVDYRTAIASLAPGSMGDSDAPSESKSAFDGTQVG